MAASLKIRARFLILQIVITAVIVTKVVPVNTEDDVSDSLKSITSKTTYHTVQTSVTSYVITPGPTISSATNTNGYSAEDKITDRTQLLNSDDVTFHSTSTEKTTTKTSVIEEQSNYNCSFESEDIAVFNPKAFSNCGVNGPFPMFPSSKDGSAEECESGSFVFRWDSSRNSTIKECEQMTLEMPFNITVPKCNSNICSNGESNICNCDKICHVYKDCCYSVIEDLIKSHNDLNDTVAAIDSKATLPDFNDDIYIYNHSSCVGDSEGLSQFWLIDKCPQDVIAQQDGYRVQCETSPDEYSVSNIPVSYVNTTGRVLAFKNAQCALCHGVKKDRIIFWRIKAYCLNQSSASNHTLSLQEIEENCVVKVKPPETVNNVYLRKCLKPNLTQSTCTNISSNQESLLQNLCNAYHYPFQDLDDNIYENPHCATCFSNNTYLNNFRCYEQKTEEKGIAGKDNHFDIDFRVLFDFNQDFIITTHAKCTGSDTCSFGEIFDCVSRVCRQLSCVPGQIADGVVCTNDNTSISVNLPTDHSKFTNSSFGNSLLIIEIVSDKKAMQNYEKIFKTSQFTEPIIDVRVFHNYGSSQDGYVNDIVRFKNNSILQLVQTYGNAFNFTVELFQNIIELFIIDETIEMKISARNYESDIFLECPQGVLLNDKMALLSNNDKYKIVLSDYNISISAYDAYWNIELKDGVIILESVITCIHNQSYLGCPLIAFNKSEVSIVNTTVFVTNTSLVFHKEEYIVRDGRVFVCLESVNQRDEFINLFEYSMHFKWLSIISSSLSTFGLFLVILFHCMFKQLRNINGLNLTALSATMLLIHVMMLSQSQIHHKVTCVTFAVVMHFLLLKMFAWMNIIAFDMAVLFKSNLGTDRSNTLSRFLRYLTVASGISLIITSVSVTFNFSNIGINPGYGERNICWITNPQALIAFVGVPVGIYIVMNYVLFGFIIYTIQRKRFSSTSGRRTYCVVYFKMSLIIGFTWIVGILGAFIRNNGFWMVHVVLNGLQGVSLFLCFIVNARLVAKLRTHTFSKTTTDNLSTIKAKSGISFQKSNGH